ncbi:MFS transporter [Microbacterium sp. ARD32]|uniref:MFS transporter n=1 Tax=Microbacterium sp. ARD32 TaxID=2962577 RepID=UPI0028822F61|nr:MFS transporter [Microbacterium sp. ARD32]MDT0156508.1 MFS transporter [Microbacterium sp. ARD32]
MQDSPRRWWMLGVLILSLLVVQLDTMILGVAVQRLSAPRPSGLGLTQGELLWVLNAYTLVLAGSLLAAGTIADRFGRRRMLLVGLVLFGGGSLLCAFAPSGDVLTGGRVALGIAAAVITPTTLAIIADVFSDAERPRAIGIWSGGVGAAIALGPVVGGLLLDHFWWGSIFLINVPIVSVAIAVIPALTPESRAANPKRIDVIGILLSMLGMVLVIDGLIAGGDSGDWMAPQVWAPLLGGMLVLVLFVGWERRAPSPLLELAWFRRREFSASIAVMTVAFFTMLGSMFLLSLYLLVLRRLDVLAVGLLLLPLAAAQLVLSGRTPAWSKRLGHSTTAALGMLILAASFAALSFADTSTPLWWIEIPLALIGAGIAFVMPAASASVMGAVPREQAGSASATSNAFRQLGGALGLAVLGAALSAAYREQMAPHLGALPEGVRDAAAGSLQVTQAVLEESDPHVAASVLPFAEQSFVSGLHSAALVAAGVALFGALVALIALPRRRGRAPLRSEPARAAGDRRNMI